MAQTICRLLVGLLLVPAADKPSTLADYMRLSGPNPDERLSYGASPYQFVEVFQPRGPGPFPVAILIHGGCFKNEYQGMPQMRGIAGALSSQGIAVWSIEYRGLDEPGGGYPGTFQDVNAALDMLAPQAKGRHFDIDRVVAVGHSAGAYLALWIAGRVWCPHQVRSMTLNRFRCGTSSLWAASAIFGAIGNIFRNPVDTQYLK